MTTHLLVLFIHVVAATLLVGGSMVASPAVGAGIRRAATVQELRTCLALARPLALVAQVSSLVLLASGIYLATTRGFWSLAWVQVATVFWVVNSIVAARYYKPAMLQLAGEAFRATDGALPAPLAALRVSARVKLPANILLANNIALLFQMTVKPGLTGSLLAVALANAAVLLVGLSPARARPPRPAPALAPDA